MTKAVAKVAGRDHHASEQEILGIPADFPPKRSSTSENRLTPGASGGSSSSIGSFPGVPQPLDQLGEGLEGRCGIAELAAGSHRLEQGGGLGGRRREGREQAAQSMSRLPQVGRVFRPDGLAEPAPGNPGRWSGRRGSACPAAPDRRRRPRAGWPGRAGSPGSVDEASGRLGRGPAGQHAIDGREELRGGGSAWPGSRPCRPARQRSRSLFIERAVSAMTGRCPPAACSRCSQGLDHLEAVAAPACGRPGASGRSGPAPARPGPRGRRSRPGRRAPCGASRCSRSCWLKALSSATRMRSGAAAGPAVAGRDPAAAMRSARPAALGRVRPGQHPVDDLQQLLLLDRLHQRGRRSPARGSGRGRRAGPRRSAG